MKSRSEQERIARSEHREKLAKSIAGNTCNRYSHVVKAEGTGDRVINAQEDTHLRELKIKSAAAAYNELRKCGYPIHNARSAGVDILSSDKLLSGNVIKEASFTVKFDVPIANNGQKGIKTASVNVHYSDGKMRTANEFQFENVKYPVSKSSFARVASIQAAPAVGDNIYTVTVLDGANHKIIGSTEMAPALVTTLRTGGYTVALRNPQEALGLEIDKPFYEVVASSKTVEQVRETVAHLITQAEKCNKRIAQETNPGTVLVPATKELENFRSEAAQLEAKITDFQKVVADYADALAKKEGYENNAQMQARLASLKKQVQTAAEQLGAPLIQMADGKLLAKITAARLNDVAWKTYLDTLAKKAKRLVSYITRWAGLFQTMTVNTSYKEIEPEDIAKTFKKQTETQSKIDNFYDNQKDLAQKAPKYILEGATGHTNTKKAQVDPTMLLEQAIQDIAERGDTEAELLKQYEQQANNQEKVEEANEEYPLPEKLASKGRPSTRPISTSFDRKLSESEKQQLSQLKFSAAGSHRHWAFQRVGSKKDEPGEIKGLVGKYIHAGFSESEAMEEIRRKASEGKERYAEVFLFPAKQAQQALEQQDYGIVKKGGYVLGEVNDLVALPGKPTSKHMAEVYFYTGGRLHNERMAVLLVGNRAFIDFLKNEEKML